MRNKASRIATQLIKRRKNQREMETESSLKFRKSYCCLNGFAKERDDSQILDYVHAQKATNDTLRDLPEFN